MIDFSNIRGETVEGRRSYFEQLVCHLARLDEVVGEFRRVEGAGGDGGVEAIRILPNRRKVGYQAKYYPERDKINWTNIYKSVKTALAQHPELERYVIALPCDFTGKRAAREGNSTEGVWGKWEAQLKRWKALAAACKMKVEFVPWTAFDLETVLLKPHAQHLIRFFFDRLVLTQQWMRM
jgi:sugar phosphate isomerase/epimerase